MLCQYLKNKNTLTQTVIRLKLKLQAILEIKNEPYLQHAMDLCEFLYVSNVLVIL